MIIVEDFSVSMPKSSHLKMITPDANLPLCSSCQHRQLNTMMADWKGSDFLKACGPYFLRGSLSCLS